MVKNKVNNPKTFDWLQQMRFYFDPKNTNVLEQLSIQARPNFYAMLMYNFLLGMTELTFYQQIKFRFATGI